MTRIDEYAPWEALAKDEEFWAGFQKELEKALTDRLLPVFMAGAYAGARLLPKRLRPEDLSAEKHLSGQHDQMTHAHGGFGSPAIGPVTARQQANAAKWLEKNGLTSESLEANAESFFSGATAAQRKAGMGWYDDAHDYASALAERHGVSIQTASGVLAATSPRSRWSVNKESANTVLTLAKRRGVGGDIKGVGPVTGDNLKKALAVARGADPEATLGGSKVRSFYHNILEPRASRETTIDTHMINALAGGGRAMGDKFTASVFHSTALYSVFKSTVDKVAERHGVRHSQAQAIIWTKQVDSLGAGAKTMIFKAQDDDLLEPGKGLFAGGDEALTDAEYLSKLEHDMRARGETEEDIREALGDVVLYSTGRTLARGEKHLQGRHDQMTHAHGGGGHDFSDAEATALHDSNAGWAEGLSRDERSAIEGYAGFGSKEINEWQRGGEEALRADLDKYYRGREGDLAERVGQIEREAGRVQSVIDNGPAFDRDVIVHRGMSLEPGTTASSIREGGAFTDRAFQSTMLGERADYARDYSVMDQGHHLIMAGRIDADSYPERESVYLKVTVPKGTHYADVSAVRKRSNADAARRESEILLGPAKYRVTKVRLNAGTREYDNRHIPYHEVEATWGPA